MRQPYDKRSLGGTMQNRGHQTSWLPQAINEESHGWIPHRLSSEPCFVNTLMLDFWTLKPGTMNFYYFVTEALGNSWMHIIYSWRFLPIFYPVLEFSSISVHYSYILLTRIIACRTGKASFGSIQHFSMYKSFESSFLTMTQKTSVLKRLHLSPHCYYLSFFLS